MIEAEERFHPWMIAFSRPITACAMERSAIPGSPRARRSAPAPARGFADRLAALDDFLDWVRLSGQTRAGSVGVSYSDRSASNGSTRVADRADI